MRRGREACSCFDDRKSIWVKKNVDFNSATQIMPQAFSEHIFFKQSML